MHNALALAMHATPLFMLWALAGRAARRLKAFLAAVFVVSAGLMVA